MGTEVQEDERASGVGVGLMEGMMRCFQDKIERTQDEWYGDWESQKGINVRCSSSMTIDPVIR
jgi:hypothetical protein